MIDGSEGKEYVTCKICNRKLSLIQKRHILKHGITLEEYKNRFPDQIYFAQYYRNKISENSKRQTTSKLSWNERFGEEEANERKNIWRKEMEKRITCGIIKRRMTKIHQTIYNNLINANTGYDFINEYCIKYYNVDIAVPAKKIAIEIQGDFFHNSQNLPVEKLSKIQKRNVRNDKAKYTFLTRKGWKVIYIWEHEIQRDLKSCINKILEELKVENSLKEYDYSLIEKKEEFCIICGKDLKHSQKRYCSKECTIKDHFGKRINKLVKSICKVCRTEIVDYKKRIFCSIGCHKKYRKENNISEEHKQNMSESMKNSDYSKKRREEKRITLSCEYCGKTFWTHECRIKNNARFCSHKCYLENRFKPQKEKKEQL